jgi:putative hemolysin
MTPILAVAALLFFAGLSFFFVLAETALFSLAKWQIRQLGERSPQFGGMVSRLLNQPQDLLATIVLGNTLANAAMIALALWVSLRQEWSMPLVVAGLFLFILFGAEAAPKTLAVRAPERWSLRIARPMLYLQALTRPLRSIGQNFNAAILKAVIPKGVRPKAMLTDEEYHELLEMAYQQGTLAKSERDIILQIISLDQRTAKDAMKPRLQITCLPDDLSVEEMMAAARRYKHRRLPLYDESPDTIVGILNTQTLLLNPASDLADAIEFPSFVPETMNLLQLLKSLQRQQRGLAIVLDEYGGTAGMITMEDILEEVVGEIRDELELEGVLIEPDGPGRWRVNAAMRIDDFRREHPAIGDVPEVETIGGLVMDRLGVVPKTGESIEFNGLRLTVLSADERRVREVLIEVPKMK